MKARDVLDPILSHAKASGRFDNVDGHEPKSAPRHGLTAAAWIQSIDPVRASGLISTTVRIVVEVRLYSSMLQKPEDRIDPTMTDAVLDLGRRVVGDYTLGGVAKDIDVRGTHGVPMSTQAGYIEQDGKLLRVYTLRIPVIVNDVWEEAP